MTAFDAGAFDAGAFDAASGTTVALTGRSATFTQGAVTPVSGGTHIALTGQSLTAARGALSASVKPALLGASFTLGGVLTFVSDSVSTGISGQSATWTQGTLTPVTGGTSIALTGLSLTASGGILGVSVASFLTGQRAVYAQGAVTAGATTKVALTGQSVTSAQGLLQSSSAVSLLGAQIIAAQGIMAAVVPVDVVVALTGLFASFVQGLVIGQGGYEDMPKLTAYKSQYVVVPRVEVRRVRRYCKRRIIGNFNGALDSGSLITRVTWECTSPQSTIMSNPQILTGQRSVSVDVQFNYSGWGGLLATVTADDGSVQNLEFSITVTNAPFYPSAVYNNATGPYIVSASK